MSAIGMASRQRVALTLGFKRTLMAAGGGVCFAACALESAVPDQDGGGDAAMRGPITIAYTTQPIGGRYSPRNVGAAWIEASDGRYLKTLEKWGFLRGTALVSWQAASGGNTVDAIVSASKTAHEPHVATWDLTDVNGERLGDGNYVFKVELSEESIQHEVAEIPIHNGGSVPDETLPDTAFLIDITIDYP